MTTVLLAGATGVVGAFALAELLERPDVAQVIAVGRRALPTTHAKLSSLVVDLQEAAAIAAAIPVDVDVALCCLGTTRKQAGSAEAFRAVDLGAVVAFGEAAKRRGARRMLLVSSLGADAKARTLYPRTKGEAEEALGALGFEQLTVLRPSLLDDEGTRRDHRAAERLSLPIARAVFAVVGKTRRYAPIAARTVARALVRLAFDAEGERRRIVESERIHALGG